MDMEGVREEDADDSEDDGSEEEEDTEEGAGAEATGYRGATASAYDGGACSGWSIADDVECAGACWEL